MGRYNLTYVDHDLEASTIGVHTPNMTAGTFDAIAGALDDLAAAIADVTLGTLRKDSRVAVEVKNDAAAPANPFAQRETKWLVRMQEDGTGNPVSFEIPCADLALLAGGTGLMDTASAEYTALVSAIEAIVRSNDGNNVTVIEIVHVGRNN